jgi:hypothetical protein
MLNYELMLPQFFAVAVANFILGWLWYSPLLFAKPWAKALKIKMDRKMTDAEKKAMPRLFAGAIISSFAISFVLQVLVHSLNVQGAAAGATLGLLLWLGLSLPFALGTLWEKRPGVVVAVNLGNYFVINVGFCTLLAVWH